MESVAEHHLRAISTQQKLKSSSGVPSMLGAWFAFVLLALAALLFVSASRATAPVSATRSSNTATQVLTITLQEGIHDAYLDRWNANKRCGAEDPDTLKLKRESYHILLQFDLSALPQELELLNATLSLYAYRADTTSSIVAEAYQVLRPWVDTDVTWNSPRAEETWEEPGCSGAGADRAVTPSSVKVWQGTERWHEIDITEMVRSWATGVDNYGLLLAASPASSANTYYFRSANWWQDISKRPRLVITYRLISATPTGTAASPTATIQVSVTEIATPLPTAAQTAVPTVPGKYPLQPQQRVGFVGQHLGALNTVDVKRLYAGFCTFHDRVALPSERNLGLEYCTVLTLYRVYNEPDQETYRARIAQMVADNPGHLWFIGNEPENPHRDRVHSRDYARIYHDMYYFIKGLDPSAKVGVGGVVLPSAIRRRWLERVLDRYQEEFGEPMPVDVWNIHDLLLSECPRADLVPGCPYVCSGAYVPLEFGCQKGEYFSQNEQANAEEFKRLILEFRQWMKDKGFQNKPLIITEMGVFAQHADQGGRFPHEWINRFMYETFNFLMNATDRELGYPADDYHLVQRWTWFKLRERTGTVEECNGSLFAIDGEITDFGLNFANYIARFLPASPTTIFFQRGWTGYTEDCDTTLQKPVGGRPTANTLWIAADGSQKALLKFDLSILPTNAQVVSATLSLRPATRQGVGDMVVNCYGLKRPWEVSQANWISATQTTSWEAPGCNGPHDRELTPVSSVVVTSTNLTYSWDVTELARQWVEDPRTNYGVLLEGSAAGSGYWTFVSSDQTEDPPYNRHRLRPKLELVVQLPEPTLTPTATPTATITRLATETPTVAMTATEMISPTLTAIQTDTPTATMTLTATQTATPTNTATPTMAVYTIYLPIALKGV